ncbi:flagellar motor protein MotB [Hydrocarboniclastica marina]|uniref:Type VI secretion system protein TssL n=1 Tax=Hydrocarboniclastica marina TaxID=2259620 RepID=A0A4P7XCM2_9ALTE|nr:flagellar motor protein MotB [Hydrocarboniclastica marina]MAM00480.1 type VI secretion system protein TssL [Alteromonadaceae bacterium]QCF24496.1 type VI secretion system protein TssL [Hydrocarboniclastica marina]
MAVLLGRKRGAAAGQPSWLMTFADLMMLLLTFFILLLSFSEIDAEKYRAMINSMGAAFGTQPLQTTLPGTGTEPGSGTEAAVQQAGALSGGVEPSAGVTIATAQSVPQIVAGLPLGAVGWQSAVAPGVEQLASVLIGQLEEEVAAGRLAVNYDQRRVVVRFSEEATFPSGAATIKPQVQPIIDRIVDALSQCSGEIVVGGHSDDLPIISSRYRSNWDLSAARAVSVVHQLVLDRRIEARRVMAAGHAETQPLVPNDSASNRALNRRVDISIYEPSCGQLFEDAPGIAPAAGE